MVSRPINPKRWVDQNLRIIFTVGRMGRENQNHNCRGPDHVLESRMEPGCRWTISNHYKWSLDFFEENRGMEGLWAEINHHDPKGN